LHGADVPTTCADRSWISEWLPAGIAAAVQRAERRLRRQLASERTILRPARGRLAACCVLAQPGPSARSISGSLSKR